MYMNIGGVYTNILTKANRNVSGQVTESNDCWPYDNTFSYDSDTGALVAQTIGALRYGRAYCHFEHAYDRPGRITKQTFGAEGTPSQTWAYGYDNARNKLVSITSSHVAGLQSASATYEYDDAGRIVTRTMRTGAKTTYQYDCGGRLTRYANFFKVANTPHSRAWSYEYDLSRNKTKITIDDSMDYADATVLYSYDPLNRLTREERQSTKAPYVITYAFDAVGNRLGMTKTDGVGPTKSTTYVYNANDQLTNLTRRSDNWVEATHAYAYDYAGCLTSVTKYSGYDQSNHVNTYGWDSLGRMTRKAANNNSVVETMAYNPEGKLIATSSTGQTKVYAWQGETNFYQAISTKSDPYPNWSHTIATAGPESVGNVYDAYYPETNGYQGILYDERGNTDMSIDSYENLLYYFIRDAYGNWIDTRNGNDQYPGFLTAPVGQTGKMWDWSTGLYYFNARWYDPETGRFLSRAGARPDREHSYVFCENNPIARVDPGGGRSVSSDTMPLPSSCFSIPAIKKFATDMGAYAGRFYPKDGDTKSNAFRHCLGQCVLANECGDMIAEAAGLYHEFFPDGFAFPYERDNVADFINNFIGRQLAAAIRGDSAKCACACKKAVDENITDNKTLFSR